MNKHEFPLLSREANLGQPDFTAISDLFTASSLDNFDSSPKANRQTQTDEYYMRRALAVGQLARGRSAPNPAVGAIIVDARDQIVGRGFTQPAGQAHAEVMALAQAGKLAKNATLYATLEPCAAHGKTPPCVDAILKAGIRRVCYAVADPNPLMQGGAKQLEQAGLQVSGGILAAEAREVHAAFFHWLRTKCPFVVAKYAMTLDGKIATHTGDSRWITGPVARQAVHNLRDECDAIMVGINTVLADDPALTVRLGDFGQSSSAARPRQPLRVILDSTGRIPLQAQVVAPGTLLATTDRLPTNLENELTRRGVEVVRFPSDENGRVSLAAVLANLGQRGILQLLVEGGSALLAEFFFGATENRPQKVWAFIAPRLSGGTVAPGPVGGTGCSKMAEAIELERISWHKFGADLLVEGYLAGEDF